MTSVGDEFNSDIVAALKKRAAGQAAAPSPSPAYGSGDYQVSPADSPNFGNFPSDSGGTQPQGLIQSSDSPTVQSTKKALKQKQDQIGQKYPATDPGEN